MNSLDSIRIPIENDLNDFDRQFKSVFQSKYFLLNKVTQYIIKTKGKQMRPLLVFLSAGMHGSICPSTHRAASLIEMLHTATLIHDDVVDDSNERRGFFSINALWKNKIAVLVGDYLLSKGLLLALDHQEHQLLSIVADATRQMSEGELLQIEKARHLNVEEDVYFEIIEMKTATLFAACTAGGAASVRADQEIVDKMYRMGLYLGIAFQIKDDLFDFDQNNKAGKPSGTDLKEKKLTLPILYLLQQSGYLEKRKIIRSIKNPQKDSFQKILDKIISCGGMDYSRKKMMEYRDKSVAILQEFPDSPYKKSMEALIDFSIQREH